ncbi:MAG TPA: response regulator transcription factor [Dehalococcoidia bacterium]|nr:response regulator transcription factor [Dehalococcoidia bacterium]
MQVLIIDDDPVITETVSICFGLRWPDSEVVIAGSGEQALKVLRTASPDVIMLDVGLPGMDGFDTLRRLRELSDAPVIMLTAKDGEVGKVKGLEWGADDYMTKPFSHIELLARVKAVLRRTGESVKSKPQGSYHNAAAGLDIDYDARTVSRHGQRVSLAPLEYSLLCQLVGNEGRVVPHETLLTRVWGREYAHDLDYLKVYTRRLRTKLGDDPQDPELIHSERGVGYMFQVRCKGASPNSGEGSP